MRCPHVVHLDPYGKPVRKARYCILEAGHTGPHLNEERPGSDAEQESRAVLNETRLNDQESSAVPESIAISDEESANNSVNALLGAATDLSPYELQWFLRENTSLSSEMAWDRLSRGCDWTVGDIFELSDAWRVKASVFAGAIAEVKGGADPSSVVAKFSLDRQDSIAFAAEVGGTR